MAVKTRQFPAGLHVLIVDDDINYLLILEKMLRDCLYEVTKCNRADIALSMLRENKNRFDIVITDVHMPDMDGLQLLEHVVMEMDLPVVMMSGDAGNYVVMNGVTHGACDYLIKPVSIEALKNIWQHVVRKRKNEWKEFEQSGSLVEGDGKLKQSEDSDNSCSVNGGNRKSSKKRKEDEHETEETDDTSVVKKPRVVWSVELHQQFVAAVNQLGLNQAFPKKILELMNVPGITRENVASHLQKYRLYLRKLSGVPSNQTNSFMSPQQATLQPFSSLNGHQQHVNQMNFLHGIPTTMEPKHHLVSLHHTENSTGNLNMQVGVQSNSLMVQMVQPQFRPLTLDEPTVVHAPRLPSHTAQMMLSNGVAPNVSTRNGILENIRAPGYYPVSQASLELPDNSFCLGSTPGIKGQGGFMPGYDIFNNLDQHKSPNWELQNVGVLFDATQHPDSLQGNIDFMQSVLVPQGCSSVLVSRQNWNAAIENNGIVFSAGDDVKSENSQNDNQHMNSFLIDNPIRVDSEAVSNASPANLFNFSQEALVSALMKQQEGISPAENEFDFAGIPWMVHSSGSSVLQSGF
ncbi:hypothetical protein V6N13_009064 [Hibiscus sabdariffa]|uniref:Two-component response regulator n=1 Tax=Hibiscus sabdariffa TaxID=183260 RepID=A0ABR2NGF0_9ROSI